MNRFHSSGTASGNVEVMWTWKMIIPITAIVPIVPPLREEQEQRQRELDHGAQCARRARAPREGRRSSGWSRYSRAFALRERFHGVLLIITETTNGKWRLSFDDAAPHQMQTKTICAPTIRFSSGNRKTISSGP